MIASITGRAGKLCWLADRLSIGDAVPTYVVKNDAFLFPTDGTPAIMVGPGTGIAPFRAYLQEVEAAGLSSDTWLFFGHQHQDKGFPHKEELQAWLSSGELTRADFALGPGDQEHKVGVQHRIQQRGAELWSWLQRGATVYVCGDANHMAPDVERAFAQLAESHGNVAELAALAGTSRKARIAIARTCTWLAQFTACFCYHHHQAAPRPMVIKASPPELINAGLLDTIAALQLTGVLSAANLVGMVLSDYDRR